MKKKFIFTDFNDWLMSVDEKAIELIAIGPEETREYRGDVIFEIVLRATSESMHYSLTSDDAREIAEKSLFKNALLSRGELIPEEIGKLSESYRLLSSIKEYLSEKLTKELTKELKRKWLKDRDVKKYLKQLENEIQALFIGIGEYRTKKPHRPSDLLLNGILYKCHVAFERKSFYSRNNKIAEFINILYNKEIFSSKSGADLVRKRINYLFRTKSEKSMEKQWREIFKYASARFGYQFDLEGKGTLH